jgi:SsrA-binding protein
LLLTKKEIEHLSKEEAQKGLTIVPISVYNKGRKLKVEIAVVRGKKKFDKRETITHWLRAFDCMLQII